MDRRFEGMRVYEQNFCQDHTGQKVEFVTTDQNQRSLFKCMRCIVQRDVDAQTLININEIINSTQQTLFINFPFQEIETFKELEKVISNSQNNNKLIENVQQSFKEFKTIFYQKLQSIEAEFISLIERRGESAELLQIYNKLSRKEELKDIISNPLTSQEEKSAKLKDLFTETWSNSSENTAIILSAIDKQRHQRNPINMEKLKEVQTQILQTLDNFSLQETNKCIMNLNPQIQQELQALTQQQSQNITKLIQHISKLNLQHQNNYIDANSPIQSIQPNSSLVHRFFQSSQFYMFHEKEQQRDIASQLTNFPIFDMLPELLKLENRIELNFTPTNYCQSSNLKIKDIGDNNVSFEVLPNNECQAATQPLENQKAYKIQVTFSKPFGQTDPGVYRIGLHLHSKIHSDQILVGYKAGFRSVENSGAQLIRKGKLLTNSQLRQEINSIEMRWCIVKQQFFYSDLKYENVNQVSPSFIEPDKTYCFGVFFCEKFNQQGITITLSNFSEIDPNQVEIFS